MVYEKFIIWIEKDKLWNEQHFLENKTDITRHVLKIQYIFLLPKYIKWISMEVILRAFTYANIGHLKDKWV